jgi:hypothetical protein
LERAFFPPPLVALAEEARASVEAERQRLAAEEEARREREREAAQEQAVAEEPEEPEEAPPPVEASAPLRLRPEASGFIDLVEQRSWGLAAGVTVGSGMLEGSARVLFGDSLGVELDAGLVFGSGPFRPRVALRGTVVPGLEGGAGFGGGAVVGGRLALSPQLTALVDVGAEYFSVPSGYNNVVVMASAGLGFNLL